MKGPFGFFGAEGTELSDVAAFGAGFQPLDFFGFFFPGRCPGLGWIAPLTLG